MRRFPTQGSIRAASGQGDPTTTAQTAQTAPSVDPLAALAAAPGDYELNARVDFDFHPYPHPGPRDAEGTPVRIEGAYRVSAARAGGRWRLEVSELADVRGWDAEEGVAEAALDAEPVVLRPEGQWGSADGAALLRSLLSGGTA